MNTSSVSPPPSPSTPADARVLLIDDSPSILQVLRARCEALAGVSCATASSQAEAMAVLDRADSPFFLAVADLNLPDAPDGEVVDALQARGLPVVVLTGYLDDATRERMLAKNIVDYVLKTSLSEIDQVAALVRRLHRNRQTEALVVDDSASFRQYVGVLLEAQQLRVHRARDGREALATFAAHPGIALVITDYHMPDMDGLALIRALRQQRGREELAIVGLSDWASAALSARLLKGGASDVIAKPFLIEEFHCRIAQNLELIDRLREIREMATRDSLTGLYNRRHLFEAGAALHANARRGQLSLAAVMLDIDHFKRVNDTYGHLAGDRVIREVGRLLAAGIRTADLLGRYGGEEFCILLAGLDPASLGQILERLRAAVEQTRIRHDDLELSVTISIGASLDLGDSLQAMVEGADACLYRSKQAGRNRATIAPPA